MAKGDKAGAKKAKLPKASKAARAASGSAGKRAIAKPGKADKLSNKDYEKTLRGLHVELVKLQEWVKHAGLKVCILFEGRDGAGKGGTIKAITERVSPRVFRVVALPAPTEREKSQMYIQRYIPHLPAGGEVVIFDRSWYNRAGVERVMGFASDEQVKRFLILDDSWDPGGDELTPTMKLKRRPIAQKYAADIERLYAAISEPDVVNV